MSDRSRMLTVNGETQTLSEWARRLGVRCSVISYRLNAGWPVEKAVSLPDTHGWRNKLGKKEEEEKPEVKYRHRQTIIDVEHGNYGDIL